MVDRVTPQQRSRNMARIRSTDSAPEIRVRRAVRAMRIGYRIHERSLPGTPDLVFKGRRKVIFVHGCFWHGHGCALGGSGSKSNTAYWGPKIARNKARDEEALQSLRADGWHVLVVWECHTKDSLRLAAVLTSFLKGAEGSNEV